MPPRTDPNQTRQLILESALRCFTRKGYLRTSMDDIVAESGLSKGTLYWHFENKSDLFNNLFDLLIGDLVESFLQYQIDDDTPAAEHLHQLSRMFGTVITSDERLTEMPINLMAEVWQVQEFAARYQEMLDGFGQTLRTIVDKGIAKGEFRQVDVKRVIWSIMAAYDGLILYYMAGVLPDIEEHYEALTDLFIDGLRKPGA
jgi:TetR/AcrR family acrAB operon transcriptional repressor